MKKVLMITGGWEGHDPVLVANRFAGIMRAEGYEVDIFDNYDILHDLDKLREYDLFVPHCTMSQLPEGTPGNISTAIAEGMGLAGCHGGMCDAFRMNTEWQFICGGQWVSHPGGDGVEYTVNIRHGSSPIVEGLQDFTVKSEHYYLHIDPAVEILATTRFPLVNYYHAANKPVDMPVAWTKFWGNGRVFYTSLGHHDDVFDHPTAELLMERGLVWAAEGKEYAEKNGLDATAFDNPAKMY